VVHVVSHNYAEVVSLDEEIVTQIMLTILIALTAVACVLVLAIPVHRAIITALNILLVVINILGFMGYAGITYNPVSFCTLTMAIGFCVDYTVELMHFSSTAAAGARMAQKMGGAVAVCGYDVLHGCCTAIVGCLVISFVPGEAFRMFGHLSMVMCGYGGMYALWCLPATMILFEEAVFTCCCTAPESDSPNARTVDAHEVPAKAPASLVAPAKVPGSPAKSPPSPTRPSASPAMKKSQAIMAKLQAQTQRTNVSATSASASTAYPSAAPPSCPAKVARTTFMEM